MSRQTRSRDRTADTTTNALLTCGVVGGPLYVVVSLIQVFTTEGFDLERHPFSFLSLGDLGWIQIANFVVSGMLFFACAVGLKRALRTGRGRTWGPLLYAGFGLGMIGGGVFVADPAFGYPAGTPDGPPAELSWHGNLHGVAFAVGFLSLIAAFVVFALRFSALGARGWFWYTVATAVGFVLLSAAGIAGGDFRIVTVAVLLGWGWASINPGRLLTR